MACSLSRKALLGSPVANWPPGHQLPGPPIQVDQAGWGGVAAGQLPAGGRSEAHWESPGTWPPEAPWSQTGTFSRALTGGRCRSCAPPLGRDRRAPAWAQAGWRSSLPASLWRGSPGPPLWAQSLCVTCSPARGQQQWPLQEGACWEAGGLRGPSPPCASRGGREDCLAEPGPTHTCLFISGK